MFRVAPPLPTLLPFGSGMTWKLVLPGSAALGELFAEAFGLVFVGRGEDNVVPTGEGFTSQGTGVVFLGVLEGLMEEIKASFSDYQVYTFSSFSSLRLFSFISRWH